MYSIRKVTKDLYWVGGNDRRLSLFENIHPLTHGVSYNAYVLLDKKTVLFDTADWAVARQFIENVEGALDGRNLDYLVVHHMEPDHAATLAEVLLRWPDVTVITSAKAVQLMKQFGYEPKNVEVVKEGSTKSFGKHTITFVSAPMVHWPEVLLSYDSTNGVLFSADAFGTFISLDGKLFADEVNFDRDWLDEARRYYTNIVGKYGPQVLAVLKKAATLDIKYICPLHGPVWRKDFGYILDKYTHWASYEAEEKGVLILYASMYGNTENAAEMLATKLADKGVTNTIMYDVSSTHTSYLISEIFKYSHVVFASVTYNLGIFPPMHNLLIDMKALNLQNRKVAIIENGSWAPRAGALIQKELEEMKNMELIAPYNNITSSVQKQNIGEMDSLVDAIAESLK